MNRVMMQVYTKDSKEAVDTYMKAFDATLGFNVKDGEDNYYHCELDICGNTLAVAELKDGMEERVTGNTMQFCLHYGEGKEGQVTKAYEILKEGSEIIFPLGPCDFSPLCTDLIDKFGVRWCLFV